MRSYTQIGWIIMGCVGILAILFWGDEVTEARNYWALWI